MKKFLSLLFLLSIAIHQLLAQSEFIDHSSIELKAGVYKSIELSEELSSFAIKSDIDLSRIDLFIDNERIALVSNSHIDDKSSQISELIFPLEGSKYLVLYSEVITNVELYLLKVPKLNSALSTKMIKADSCEKPMGIDQNVWRSGLPAPVVPPTLNQVNHCIVHHSAGSNTTTDYTEVVRNIYVFHTDVNGWDDIGYNYLIAPDGTLYHGRDGQNTYSDDNVRGAHFCGKNTGTMGICLLGDFTTAVPQLAALSTLEDLLLWKLNKESLLPGDSARHPLPGGAYLGRVVGHKDGCATACPGTFLYADIPGIINSLESRINDCPSPSELANQFHTKEIKIYPNPTNEFVMIESKLEGTLILDDLLGKEIFREEKRDEKFKLNVGAYPVGSYFIHLIGKDKHLERKLLIVR